MKSSYTQNKIEVTQLAECLQQQKLSVRIPGSDVVSELYLPHNIMNHAELPPKHEALQKLFGLAKRSELISDRKSTRLNSSHPV